MKARLQTVSLSIAVLSACAPMPGADQSDGAATSDDSESPGEAEEGEEDEGGEQAGDEGDESEVEDGDDESDATNDDQGDGDESETVTSDGDDGEDGTESGDDSDSLDESTGDESDATGDSDDSGCCIKPSHVSQDEMDATVLDFYRYWKSEYVRPAGSTPNGYYIASSGETGSTEGAITVSEAQGFGMIITALMAKNAPSEDDDAREVFDGLYRFFLDHPSDVSEDLMSWEVLGDGQGGEQDKRSSTATDGDIDIAYALLLAHSHWGSSGEIDYLAAAIRVIDALPGHNIGRTTKRTLLGSWDQESLYRTRASDWMTGEFNAFADATGDSYWDEVVETTYSLAQSMVEAYAPDTGLVPDFVVNEVPEPAEPNFLEFEFDGEYYNNSCRVPLRIMTDVRHYETRYAVQWMTRVARWIHEKTGGDPSTIVGGYYIADGEEIRQMQFPAFTAPFVAAATIHPDYQGFVDAGWDVISVWRTNYYNDCINLLAMIQISGKWWKPEL